MISALISLSYANASDKSTSSKLHEQINDQTLFQRVTGLDTSLVAHIVVSSDRFLESCSESTAVGSMVGKINQFLSSSGVPKKSLLTTDEFVLAGLTILITLIGYYFFLGKRHHKKRLRLAEDLEIAHAKVHFLEEKLMLATAEDMRKNGNQPEKRDIRIFMDGAFDMMHYGHMNAFRLGRSLGTQLIVGVNSDESITQCKGAPLMNDAERLTMVEGCKFVDQVVPNCPYVMSEEYLDHVIKEYKVDYVVHGDDPCIVDGKDVYESAKKAGKYQSIPRTEGVSTTDIVGRMLTLRKDHHYGKSSPIGDETSEEKKVNELLCHQSKFLTTSRMLRLFSSGMSSPQSGAKVIYIDGAWDMFHCGHVEILKAAKQRGDFLIVGVHNDSIVNNSRGANLPLMNLHERVLAILGCRYVDDVLIDAPWHITSEMISSLGISEVVRGTNSDEIGKGYNSVESRYSYPKKIGIYNEIESPIDFNLSSIMKRIQTNQEMFSAKIAKKKKAENEYYDDRYGRRKEPQ